MSRVTTRFLIPTLFVIAACAMMIGLGVWQLQRHDWKTALLASYAQAPGKPAIAYPVAPTADSAPYFRKSGFECARVVGWTATAGRNVRGVSGWSHLARCKLGLAGSEAIVDAGWSKSPANPAWSGGTVSGLIAPDTARIIRLVSAVPLAHGLEASMPPQLEDIPNNHMAYAVQWFLFAGVAALVFGLALRQRRAAS